MPAAPGKKITTSELSRLMALRDSGSVPRSPVSGRCVKIGISTQGLGYPRFGSAASDADDGDHADDHPATARGLVECLRDRRHHATASAGEQMHALGRKPASYLLRAPLVRLATRAHHADNR